MIVDDCMVSLMMMSMASMMVIIDEYEYDVDARRACSDELEPTVCT